VAWANEGGEGEPGHGDEVFFEGHALVAVEDRAAAANLAITAADGRRHTGDLEPLLLALVARAAKEFEGLEEEGCDVVRLQAARIGALHVFADAPHGGPVHAVAGERALF
jgi:hypothetical protein